MERQRREDEHGENRPSSALRLAETLHSGRDARTTEGVKTERLTYRFEYGDAVGADVAAWSHSQTPDQASAQIAETTNTRAQVHHQQVAAAVLVM